MKCHSCNQQAITIMGGYSYCKEHLEKEKWWADVITFIGTIIMSVGFIWLACLIWEGQKIDR